MGGGADTGGAEAAIGTDETAPGGTGAPPTGAGPYR